MSGVPVGRGPLPLAIALALGIALALLALWSLQAGRGGPFALLTLLVLAASPVAFVLLCIVLAGVALSRSSRGAELALPLAILCTATSVELVLLRLFPAGGRYPFSLPEFAAACGRIDAPLMYLDGPDYATYIAATYKKETLLIDKLKLKELMAKG